MEAMAEKKLMDMLPSELRPTFQSLFQMDEETRAVVKAADKLCAYIKCLEEGKAGNQEFQRARRISKEPFWKTRCPRSGILWNILWRASPLPWSELN